MSIELKGISKAFRQKKLFDPLHVSFYAGACHCIMGENGTGKTTLLKILAGLEKADTGTFHSTGDCTFAGSNPYMLRGNVLDNLMFPMTLKRNKDKYTQKDAIRMLEKLGLEQLMDQDASTLSAGEKQKVALGRALVWQPDVLLLDEPTANIDRYMIENIETILLDYVADPKHTLIIVSHDFEQVKRISGTLWTLKDQTLFKETEHGILKCC